MELIIQFKELEDDTDSWTAEDKYHQELRDHGIVVFHDVLVRGKGELLFCKWS